MYRKAIATSALAALLGPTATLARPVAYEIEFDRSSATTLEFGGVRLFARNGKRVWATTIPANGEVRLSYRVTRR